MKLKSRDTDDEGFIPSYANFFEVKTDLQVKKVAESEFRIDFSVFWALVPENLGFCRYTPFFSKFRKNGFSSYSLRKSRTCFFTKF